MYARNGGDWARIFKVMKYTRAVLVPRQRLLQDSPIVWSLFQFGITGVPDVTGEEINGHVKDSKTT